MTTYAVTGATGGLGGAAVRALIAGGTPATDIVAIVRDAAKAADLNAAGVSVRVADYSDPESLRDALAGVDRLLLVSGSAIGQRVPQHRNVIEAAETARVSLIAYTSVLRADSSPMILAADHVATEKLLAASPIASTILRNGWYWENYLTRQTIESGTLIGSADEGRVAGAARVDYAVAAAHALVEANGGEVYELAGGEHHTYAEIAEALTEATGKSISYTNIPEADYAAGLVAAGLPEALAATLANCDAGVAAGALDSDSTDLSTLIGRPATSLRDALLAGVAINV